METKAVIDKINNGKCDGLLRDLYVDESLIDYQRERYIKALNQFMELYGNKEVEIYSVPGRSEICGNHTDHQHGEVLAGAINLDMIAIVCRDKSVKVVSDDYDIKEIRLDDLALHEREKGTSQALIRGTLARFKALGYKIGGFDGYMTSDVLVGSGLSSSAAFEVMIGTILSGLYNEGKIDALTIAQIGQYAENEYFGKPCGLMDQCACSIGSLIHIDFKTTTIDRIAVDFNEFKHSLCIVDVHASHADLTQDYGDVPDEMKKVAHYFNKEFLREVDEQAFYDHIPEVREAVNDRAVLRTIHFFEEDKRVRSAVKALKEKDFNAFKEVIKASGESSYKYLQNIYSNHDYQHQAVSLALCLSEMILGKHGICRVHGGGFAGTIQAFVEENFVDDYKNAIEKYFGKGSCHVLKIRKYGGKKVL